MTRFAIAILSMLIALPVSAQTIKLGTLAPEGSVWHTALRDMAEAWTEESGGKVRVRIYPGGVAGDDSDMVRKMRVGQLQAAALTGEGLAGIAAEMRVFQTPMLLRNDAELDHVRDVIGPDLEALIEAKGFKVLYWSDVGWVYLYATEPVVRPADLKRLRIWTWSGDAAWADALRQVGYQPVPLPATEIHTGLQSGLFDAFTTTPVAALSFQWFGQAPHMTSMRWAPLTAAMVISTKTWNRIPANLRPGLLKRSQEAALSAQTSVRNFEKEAVETMKGFGLQIHEVPADARIEWERDAEAGYPALMGASIPEEIFTRARAVRDAFRGGNGGE